MADIELCIRGCHMCPFYVANDHKEDHHYCYVWNSLLSCSDKLLKSFEGHDKEHPAGFDPVNRDEVVPSGCPILNRPVELRTLPIDVWAASERETHYEE